ncbi:MAG: histone deacetylase [Candidatus Zixiibacteriota bacterium]
MKIGLIDLIQPDLHPAPIDHPETPERIQSALDYVQKSDIAGDLELIMPTPVGSEILKQVHSPGYIDFIEQAADEGTTGIDEDTYLSRGSFKAAKTTALTVAGAVDLIMHDKYKYIFMAGRPPGHHAEYDRAMGFCLINNAAVAAEYLSQKYNRKRIAIIDWDVHHGNGTQNIFYNRSDIFYISMHQYPFYPGTGRSDEIGRGEGEGYNLNLPLSAGSNNEIYLKNFEEKIIPGLEKYCPEFIIISCGFDAHRDDPLGEMNMTERGFGDMTKLTKEIADKYAEGRILSLFEGGYNPISNGLSLFEHLMELI